MLRATQLVHLHRPEISAIFGVDRSAVLTFIANVLKAYDPMIRSVGHFSFVTDITGIGGTLNKLRAYVTDPTYHRAADPKDPGARITRTLQDWEVITEALAAGLYPQTDRTYLSKVQVAGSEQTLLAAMGLWMKQGARLTPEVLTYSPIMDQGSTPTPEEAAFIRTALCFSWDTLIASNHLVTVPAPGEGVARGPYERLMRALRIVGVQVALLISTRVLALRPYASLAREPHVRERLIIKFGANAKDYLEMLDELAALPMHAWHAMADSLTQPGRNLTPWGAATPTLGVDQHVLAAVLGNGEPTPTSPVDPTETIQWERVFTYAKQFKAELRLLREDQGLALDSAFAALRFTSVGPRPNIPLMGPELTPVHTDGTVLTEPLAPLDLLYKPILPARLYNQTMRWIGEPRLMTQVDITADASRVHIEPEDVPIMSAHILGRLSPSQLQSADLWQGEEDALFTPGTIEGLANLFGVSQDEMLETVGTPPKPEWAHIFDQTNGHVEPRDPQQLFYTSTQTRRPSLRMVTLNRHHVRALHAMQYGLIVRTEQTRAQFVRDLEVPMPTYDITEKLRTFASSLAGRAR